MGDNVYNLIGFHIAPSMCNMPRQKANKLRAVRIYCEEVISTSDEWHSSWVVGIGTGAV